MLELIRHKRVIHDRLDALRQSIDSGRVLYPANLSRFVFLCGANKTKDEISERRKALMEFAKRNLPDTHFFIAEKIFSTLQQEGHKGNLLDAEHLISDFSDHVLIVLESPSAFAELGAFSRPPLREKLVIINDSRYKGRDSFINLGPIAAVKESAESDKIIYYKMCDDGVIVRDAIGETFARIHDLFKDPISGTAKPAKLDDLHPGHKFNKLSAMFLHDLIYMAGPLLHKEIIEILIKIFGKAVFNNVSHLLAILCAFNSLHRNASGLYKSSRVHLYYKYRTDIDLLISAFRNYMQKEFPDRLYAY